MTNLREGIGLRSYGQEDPLRAYTMEGFELFDDMQRSIDKEVTTFIVRAQVEGNLERKEVSKVLLTNEDQDPKKRKRNRKQRRGSKYF